MHQTTPRSVDLKYRPNSYFWADELGLTLSSSIKGVERKAEYERSLTTGEEFPSLLAESTLSRGMRDFVGRIHPRLMGGEYLPDREQKEVVIARIAIASTTGDVVCVYARRSKNRIHYRVVDEYGGDTLSSRSTRTSVKPLSLVQLLDFFIGAWDVLDVLDMNFADRGYPRDVCHDFLVELSSDFYPDFEDAVRERVNRWLDTVAPVDTEDTNNTGEDES